MTQHPLARDRRAGYERALREAGLPFDERLIAGQSWMFSEGVTAAAELLARGERPTAIFAANDHLALGAMTTLRQRRLRVPDDVAVIGYDDGPRASQADPPLTTVHVPLLEIGRRAARLLLQSITASGEIAPVHEVLPAVIIRRGTA